MIEVIFPTAWDNQGTRKVAFAHVFRSLAAHLGYDVGASLKVQGAYAFEMHKGGKTVRIGLKTSYDRWLNTATKMAEKADEVWVMTFRWNGPAEGDEVPTHLEVYRISSADLLAKFAKVDTARNAAGSPNAFAYIPLDEAGLQEDTYDYQKVAGFVLDTATLLFEAPLKFSDQGPARVAAITTAATTPARPQPELARPDVFARAKLLVAGELNIDPGKVTISVTV